MLTVWVLPLAVLATVTNNLQQMALWLVGLFVTFILAASLLQARGENTATSLVLIALLGTAIGINLQILADRAGYIDLQGADGIALAALALFMAMLFLTGPRPGPRPMRAQDRLLSKDLTLGLTAVLPFALTHWATVALRGFPLQEHALELTWNAALMIASCAVPVAALASVSRNLQTVVLMLLAGFVVTYGPYVRY